MTKDDAILPNDIAFQLDYKPNPRFLDSRGTWAAKLVECFSLQEWMITENTVRVFNANQDTSVSIAFRRCWLGTCDCRDKTDIPSRVGRLLQLIFESPEFEKALKISRVGVRSRFFTQYDKDYNSLVNRFRERFVDIRPQVLSSLVPSASVIDVGTPYDLDTPHGKIHLLCGPETANGVKTRYMPARDVATLPQRGLYFDMDYYRDYGEGTEAFDLPRVMEDVNRFASDSWDAHMHTRQLVIG